MKLVPPGLLATVGMMALLGALSATRVAGNGGPVPARPDSPARAPVTPSGEGADTSLAIPAGDGDENPAREPGSSNTTPSGGTSEQMPSNPSAPAAPSVPSKPVATAVPFGPGEKLDYRVTVGLFGGVGRGSMEIPSIDTVRGRPCYHLKMTVRGGVPFAHVDDRLESWMDVSSLSSRRFEQDQKEPNWKRHRIWNFFPEQKSWATEEPSAVGTLPTDSPLDDVSFLYYVRTLPLTVGETYTLDRYFRAEGNPVVIKVLRVEVVSVPLGKFETIVVRPIIRTRGLFGQGGEAEVYFSNDAHRIPVMMRSKIPVLGHLNLYLERHVPGKILSGASSAPAQEK